MKAKIMTNLGTFEFEGEDESVQKQIAAILNVSTPMETVSKNTAERRNNEKSKKHMPSTACKKTGSTPKMLPNLISGKDEIDSLKAYFESKKPKSHIEIFAVLTLWLRDNKEMLDASVDEMWTLYKLLGIRPPKNLIQTYRDGKSKRGFFDSTDDGRYTITPFGETFVEHDLPPREGAQQ